MKKLILAASLLIALTSTAFAKDKHANTNLLKDLSATLNKSTEVSWVHKEQYKEAMFKFKDQVAHAFYSQDKNELIGFGIQFDMSKLPKVVTDAIQNKYAGWQAYDAIMFIDADGNTNYFLQVKNNNKVRALKITPGGTISIYSRIAS